MNADKIFTVLGSVIILATVTVVLTSSGTVGVTKAGFGGFTGLLKTAMGRA